MKTTERREALAAYKERKVMAGIYAIRCTGTDQVWLGKAPDLATIQNRQWFALRHGGNPHRSLQDAWLLHGSAAFTFEVVEIVPEADLQFGRNRALKRRLDHWVAALDGTAL